jgi:hypothetical protein
LIFSDEVLRLDLPVRTLLVEDPLKFNKTSRKELEVIGWSESDHILEIERSSNILEKGSFCHAKPPELQKLEIRISKSETNPKSQFSNYLNNMS